MSPNNISCEDSSLDKNTRDNSDPMKSSHSQKSQLIVKSSLPNLWKYEDSKLFTSPYDWLAAKRKADDIPNHVWRVHDKLYDLSSFMDKHPGGRDWIEVTQGTDITEAFESSHVINVDKVESILAKYYVGEATKARNSPYTFKEHGFYRTLKRRVEPLLKEKGTGPSGRILITQDALAIAYLIAGLQGAALGSLALQIIAGLLLGMCVVGAHNFLHMKDTWRRFYFDLCPLTSHEFRITHALSHHLFANTILDYEVTALQPLLELLPSRPKNFLQKYGSWIYSHILYSQIMTQDILKRLYMVSKGEAKVRPENALIFIQLGVFILVAGNVANGFRCWFVIISAASYWLTLIGFNAAHHHPACYHDGDLPRSEPDFGLCQLDATIDKANESDKSELLVLTTFGRHVLHHLFPTVCHSKLPLITPIFENTLEEFLESNRSATHLELFIGTHRQFARSKTLTHSEQRSHPFCERKTRICD